MSAPIGYHPFRLGEGYNPFRQQPDFDLKKIRQKAEEFAWNNIPAAQILEDINGVLNNKQFQNNPKGYLEVLQTQRGASEVMILPDDLTLQFLKENVF